jgi:hypothetical protein
MDVQMHEARIFATRIFAANILRSHGDLIASQVTMAELIDDSSSCEDEQSCSTARPCELRWWPPHRTPNTWAQTATVARNKPSEVSAKASSATARTMTLSPERIGNIVHDAFLGQ